jgi:hypothetical protein
MMEAFFFRVETGKAKSPLKLGVSSLCYTLESGIRDRSRFTFILLRNNKSRVTK